VKVVFDTNILISALLFPGGRGEQGLLRAIDGVDELFISKPILDELLTVLARKFSHDAEELSRVAVWLGELATWVEPRRKVNLASDEPDNRILECALAGRADLVVTGDKALAQLGSIEGVRIMSLREYLETQS
jgi:putative PIN family toxin of toxin-antitoxin system